MDEKKFHEIIEGVATMRSDMHTLRQDFTEFKDDTKKFHARQTEKLDELAAAWHKLGGVIKIASDNSREIKELRKECKEEREVLAQRINLLETWRNRIIGAIALLTTVMSFIKW